MIEDICRNLSLGLTRLAHLKVAADCKPFGAPADPASITLLRIKFLVFRLGNLAFRLRMRMDVRA